MNRDDYDTEGREAFALNDAPPDGEDGYKVGFRRPPRHTQFQPGVSGNPRGRPRKPKAVAQMLREIVSKPLTITEGGRKKTVTWLEGFLMQTLKAALQGDAKASDRTLRLLPAITAAFAEAEGASGPGGPAAAGGSAGEPSSAFASRADRALLEFFAEQIKRGELSFGDAPTEAQRADERDAS